MYVGLSTEHKIVLIFWLTCSYEVRAIRVLDTPDLSLRKVKLGVLMVPSCDHKIIANKVDDHLPVTKLLSDLGIAILVSLVG